MEKESTPEANTSEEEDSTSITSKQENNVAALIRTVEVLNKYGDMLRALEAKGFTSEDAKSLVETEAIGFSIKEMLHNPKMVETISSIVNALK